MTQIVDFVLHVDRYLLQFVDAYGAGWVYALLFGQVPFVKNNFSLVTIGIVVVSVLPIVFQILKHHRAKT